MGIKVRNKAYHRDNSPRVANSKGDMPTASRMMTASRRPFEYEE
jgi:hypothetical protein